MKGFAAWCIVIILILEGDAGKPDHKSRIVGGEKTSIEAHPYTISIEVGGSHTCGGSILSNYVILTAAHCTRGLTPRLIKIRAGSSIRGRGGIVKTAARKYVHAHFDINAMDYDVSILVLSQPLPFSSKIQPIRLPESHEYLQAHESAVVTGWGTLKAGGGGDITLPLCLRRVKLPIVDQAICNKVYSNGITPRMLCAGLYGQGGKDACFLDSGGPLVSNGKLHGIVSFGYGCALKKYPGVYTRVTAVREWIRSKVHL